MDPLELVRYEESECQASYAAKDTIPSPPQVQIVEETHVLSLGNICRWMVHGPPQISSMELDGFGRIAWERSNLWGHIT